VYGSDWEYDSGSGLYGVGVDDLGIWTTADYTGETTTYKLVVIEGNMQNVNFDNYLEVKQYFHLAD